MDKQERIRFLRPYLHRGFLVARPVRVAKDSGHEFERSKLLSATLSLVTQMVLLGLLRMQIYTLLPMLVMTTPKSTNTEFSSLGIGLPLSASS